MATAVDTPPAQRRAPNVNARTFVASASVTAALVAAAVIAFASIAAYVAFEGMPFSSGSSPDATVSLGSGAPQAAALAAGATAEAVAADPAAPTAAALAEILAALPPGAADGLGGGPGLAGLTDTPGSGLGRGPQGPDTQGPLGGTVSGVQDVAGGLGLNLPLSDLTDSVTKPLDDAVGGTLNNVGNGLGAGDLGDKVNRTVGGLSGQPGN